MFALIAFDADDNLWENKIFCTQDTQWLGELLVQYLDPSRVAEALEETEMRKARTMTASD